MDVIEKWVARIGVSDSLMKGTALTSHLLLTSLIATVPGFGKQGLLISAFIQLTLSGLLEIPTGIFADRWGWYRSVNMGLWLKFATTVSFLCAVFCALYGKMTLAWFFIAGESIVDAVSESFINGAYQAAYHHWFEIKGKEKNIPPEKMQNAFLKSFKYGIFIRLGLPSVAILLGYGMRQYADFNSPLFPLTLLSFLLILRLVVIFSVNKDLLHSAINEANSKEVQRRWNDQSAKNVFFKTIPQVLSYSHNGLLFYGFCGFLYVSVGSYIMGQIYYHFEHMGLAQGDAWTRGALLTLTIQTGFVLLCRFILPKLSEFKESSTTVITFFLSIVFISLMSLFLMFLDKDKIRLGVMIGYSIIVLIISQSGRSWLLNHLEKIPPEFRSTWLSCGDVLGLLLFGLSSGLILFLGLAQRGPEILIGGAALGGIFFLFRALGGSFLRERKWTLYSYLNRSIILSILLFSILGAVWEMRTFIEESLKVKRDSEQLIADLFSSSIHEALIQGSFIESVARAKRLMEKDPDVCVSLEAGFQKLINCEGWKKNRSRISTVSGEIFFDSEMKHSAGNYILYFDQIKIFSSAKFRLIGVLILFSLLGFIVLWVIRLSSKRIFGELNQLLKWKVNEKISPHFVIAEFAQIEKDLKQSIKDELEINHIKSLHRVNQQVAHDIKSPLTLVSLVEKDLLQIPEEKRILLRSAINRIRDITHHLLIDSPHFVVEEQKNEVISYQKSEIYLVGALLDQLVSEKRLQYRHLLRVEIDYGMTSLSYGLFAQFIATDFNRILSNIVNNSIESLMNQEGSVHLNLKEENNFVVIEIIDSGKGISPSLLLKLGKEKISVGKKTEELRSGSGSGSGLGLFHAFQTVKTWGGNIEIESKEGVGTTVHLRIPKAHPPIWFVDCLRVSERGTIIVVDDDPSIHRIWQDRLNSFSSKGCQWKIKNFYSSKELSCWWKERVSVHENVLVLIDYEFLGDELNGLDLIAHLKMNAFAVLVTSRFDDPQILEKAKQMGLKIIPKGLAGIVPIQVKSFATPQIL